MSGWIKLKREILDHWIAQDNEYLAVWIRMLAEANFEDRKIMFNGAFVEIKRGQLIFGLDSYSAKTGVSVRRLRTLLELLENDRMIDRQKTSKYSIISIVNYTKHQTGDTQDAPERQAGDSLATGKRQAGDNTIRIKELKEGKELKKKEICQQADDCQIIFDYWCNVMNKTGNAKLTAKREKAVLKRLAEGYTVEHIKQAIDGCKRSPFHMGQNENKTVYDDLELICRDGGNLEKFALNVGAGQNGLAASIQGYEDFVNAQ